MNHLPIVMEIEVQHYQRERLRDAEAHRLAYVCNVRATPLKRNALVGLTRRLVLAFVALLHPRGA